MTDREMLLPAEALDAEPVETVLANTWDRNAAESPGGTADEPKTEDTSPAAEPGPKPRSFLPGSGEEPDLLAGSGSAAGEAAPQEEKPPEAAAESEAAEAEAPAHWPSKDREMFAKQSPEARTWLLERSRAMEAAHTRRSQEIAPWRTVAERWKPYFDRIGAPADYAVDRLLQTEHALRTGTNAQKLNILQQLVRDYGIGAPDEPGGGEPARDPRIDDLGARIDRMQEERTRMEENTRLAERTRADQAIRTFAEARGKDGKLLHPRFGDVQGEMTVLAQADIAAGVQPDLAKLYDRAVWGNPSIRAELQAEAEAERRRTAEERTRKARQAGGSVAGAGAAAGGPVPTGSVQDTVRAVWNSLST